MGDVGAEPGAEAVGEWQGVRGHGVVRVWVSEMPFAEDGGGVSDLCKAFGEGGFLWFEVGFAVRVDDP